jgi:hypothetical protein
MWYEICRQELPHTPVKQASRDDWQRVRTFAFCDQRCREEWLCAQSIVWLDAHRKTMNGGR